MHRAFAALLGLAAACTDRPVGEDTDTGSTSVATTTSTTTAEAPTTGTASGEPDTTTAEAEPCLELEYTSDVQPTWMLTCGLPELCPGDEPLVFTTTKIDAGEVEVDDLDRARCMVAALRDRSLGQIAWWQVADVDVIWAPLSLEIVGHTALTRGVRGSPELLSGIDTYEAIRPLRPPEFFAACADGDALAVWLCLMDSVEPMCLPGPLSCPK